LTITPPPRAAITGYTARHNEMKPNTFRSHARRQVSLSTPSSLPGGMAPALFTRISTGPASAATRSTSASRLRSAAMVATFTCRRARTLAAASANIAASRPTSTTSTPSSAKTSAVARPIPFDPPVMRARLPVR
jgi:hypothetical protein